MTDASGAPAGERRTSPVELLWDLVFAFAVTEVSTLLSAHLTWGGAGRALLALALVWWAWSAFVWATNAHDPETAGFRAVLLAATALIFVAGLALPQAFGRYALFVIICLGESIVAIGLGARGDLGSRTVLVVTLALLATIGLWWIYFHRAATAAEERLAEHPDPVLAAADGYSYLHLVIVAGIIVFAAGARDAVASEGTLPAAARLALCGGVALYLAGHAAFRLRIAGTVGVAQIAAAAACLIVFAAAGGGAPWISAAAVTLVVIALAAWEDLRGARPERAPAVSP